RHVVSAADDAGAGQGVHVRLVGGLEGRAAVQRGLRLVGAAVRDDDGVLHAAIFAADGDRGKRLRRGVAAQTSALVLFFYLPPLSLWQTLQFGLALHPAPRPLRERSSMRYPTCLILAAHCLLSAGRPCLGDEKEKLPQEIRVARDGRALLPVVISTRASQRV